MEIGLRKSRRDTKVRSNKMKPLLVRLVKVTAAEMFKMKRFKDTESVLARAVRMSTNIRFTMMMNYYLYALMLMEMSRGVTNSILRDLCNKQTQTVDLKMPFHQQPKTS